MVTTDSKSVAIRATAVSHALYEAQPQLHTLQGQSRFQELFRELNFGEETLLHRLRLQKGIPYREDVDCARLLDQKTDDGAELTVFFLRCLSRKQVALSARAFAQLLEACKAPPSYLEVLGSNNGLFNSYSLNGPDLLPKDYYLMVKFPFGPFANGSLFLHHSLSTGNTTCIISTTRAQILVERLFDMFSNTALNASKAHHPFIPIGALLEHFRISNDEDRNDIDNSVCRIENRSGVSLHNFGSRTRAKIGEYALLQRELHMQDALIIMADHCFSFCAKFSEFMVAEEEKFAELLSRRRAKESRGMVTSAAQGEHADFVRASLRLNASMSTWTLEQLRALEKRLKVQLRVIDSTIAATDALTMIRLARASASDSNTMKAITILTMVFLPATFVCSLFSTGFFDFGNDGGSGGTTTSGSSGGGGQQHIRVAGQFWIYFAVTIPLTVVVLGICAAWLVWSGRRADENGEMKTSGGT